VGSARTQKARGRGKEQARGGRKGRRTAILVIAGVVLAAAAGGVTYLLVGGSSGSSPSTSAIPPISARELALQGLTGRRLLAPECAPLQGRTWVYPIGPPVPGLPPVVANIRSNLYEVFAIDYSCKTAATWIRKFSRLRIPIRHNGNETVLKGPPGYFCSAWPDANGFAYAGGCQLKGFECKPKTSYGSVYSQGLGGCKITGRGRAFGWNWNVANRRVVFAYNANGVLRLFHVSGADNNVIFRYLNGAYQLQVLNTSGIGYLNGFTWEPSPGWTVTKIKSVSGADCTVTKAGKISCTGAVHPPSCLCTGDGGLVSVTFTAAPTTKKHGYLFGGSPTQFKVTKMTPVPYLIPGTSDEALKRSGV
jgi:hypothetical protein